MKSAPRALGRDDLVLSHFSLARDHPVESRVELAASAGFAAIGLYVGQYRQLELEGFAPHGLRDLLDEHGICLAEIEVVPGLGVDGWGADRAAEAECIAWRMADEFQCRYVQTIGPAHSSLRVAAAAFGSLCDRAGGHGLVVGLEFLPFTDIAAVDQARRIVEAADRANGGICLDIWHHERGANDLAAIESLPAELITGVQLSDGPRSPSNADYYTDCLENRVALGDGEFDVEAFVAAVRGTGCEVPFAAEVCSKDGWQHAEEHVSRLAEAMRRYRSSGPSRVRVS